MPYKNTSKGSKGKMDPRTGIRQSVKTAQPKGKGMAGPTGKGNYK